MIVRDGDRVLMVQHRDADGYFWVLPGGGVKPGETLERVAGYALFLGAADTPALAPSQDVDGEVVHAVAWQRIGEDRPIGPLTPRHWSAIAPLFRAVLAEER